MSQHAYGSKGKLAVISLLLPCGFWRPATGHQARQQVPLPAEPPIGQCSFLLFGQYLLSTFSRLQVTSAYLQLATLDQFCVREPSPRYETRLGPTDPGAQAPACWSLLCF